MNANDEISLTRDLLQFNTINPPGDERDCARRVGRLLEDWGYAVDYYEYSDAGNFLKAWRGAPTVILGPGEPAMAHQTDEYCRMSKIRESVAIYEELIRDWCGI